MKTPHKEADDHKAVILGYLLFLLSLLVVISVFVNQGNVRMAWLYVLLVVGFHFLAFIPAHGKMMIFLSIILMINALIGLLNSQINLDIFLITDTLIHQADDA